MALLRAIVTVRWWFGVVNEEEVFELGILLVPECCSIGRCVRFFIGNQVPEIDVITLDSFKLIEFAEIRYVFLVFKQVIGFVGMEVEAGLDEVIPYLHPLCEIADYFLVGFFEAEGGGVTGSLVQLKVVIGAIGLFTLSVRLFSLHLVEVDIFTLLDEIQVFLINGG